MASIAETIYILWESLGPSIAEPENESCYNFLLDAFSGAVITDVHSHFEQKANAYLSDDNDQSINLLTDNEHALIRRDCHRTCAALLRCAGKMPPRSVQGLASHLSHKLSSLCKQDKNIRKVVNVSPHLALLCLWGKTDDVALSLARVISQAFECNGNTSFPFDSNSTISNDGVKTRRSARMSSSSERPISPITIPELTPDVALTVLGCILSGPDPSCVAARGSLLASRISCEVIENALGKAMFFADFILKSNTNRGGFTVEETEISLILSACESYGRLALHKEAMKSGPVCLNDQAKTLLSWITEKLIPSLPTIAKDELVEQQKHHQEECSSPFAALDVSSISLGGSNLLSPVLPCSPIPKDGSRGISNMTTTPPDRRRSSSISFGLQDTEAPLYVKAGVVSLVKSAICIFSEWLAVGGIDGDEIDNHVTQWCTILDFEAMDVDISPRKELFPVFCRLVIQLARSNSSINVLRSILTKCDEIEAGSKEEAMLKKSISSTMTCGRGTDQAKQAKRVLLTIMDAGESLINESKIDYDESDLEVPEPFDNIFPQQNNSVAIAISYVVSSGVGSAALADILNDSFGQKTEHDSKKRRALEIYSLSLLSEKRPKGHAADIRRIIHNMDTNLIQKDSKMQAWVENIMEKVAA
mmetsp:Transcript_22138/g.32568  ORF Transcript_22138/g.32568 Transcript_22138/m.32568 type:complete len:647 (+) Transcript_22138:610-2550(+)